MKIWVLHLHVHKWDGRADDDREIELLGMPDIRLLSSLDIFSDRFGGPLDRFGGHIQVRQELHLLTAWDARNIPSIWPDDHRTRKRTGIGRWVKSQQLRDSSCASWMDGGANCHLHGLEIQLAAFVPIGKDPLPLML
jgi:hypothetical protein